MNDRQWFIYTLSDPRTGQVRYVGWTYDVQQRLASHVCSAKKSAGTHRSHWIRQLLALQLRPAMSVIECGFGDWRIAERKWITHFRNLGVQLTNATDGGDGTPGFFPSAATRIAMSFAHMGRKMSPESIAKTRQAITGIKRSSECIRKMSEMRKGKIPIAATKAAAEYNRGRKQTPEHIAKRIGRLIGRSRPDKQKLTHEQVSVIRKRIQTESLRKIAKDFGVGQTVIFQIKHGSGPYKSVL